MLSASPLKTSATFFGQGWLFAHYSRQRREFPRMRADRGRPERRESGRCFPANGPADKGQRAGRWLRQAVQRLDRSRGTFTRSGVAPDPEGTINIQEKGGVVAAGASSSFPQLMARISQTQNK
jgi:hypothetical protein